MKFRSILEAAGLLFLASDISAMASPMEDVNDVLEDSVGTSDLTGISLLLN